MERVHGMRLLYFVADDELRGESPPLRMVQLTRRVILRQVLRLPSKKKGGGMKKPNSTSLTPTKHNQNNNSLNLNKNTLSNLS